MQGLFHSLGLSQISSFLSPYITIDKNRMMNDYGQRKDQKYVMFFKQSFKRRLRCRLFTKWKIKIFHSIHTDKSFSMHTDKMLQASSLTRLIYKCLFSNGRASCF